VDEFVEAHRSKFFVYYIQVVHPKLLWSLKENCCYGEAPAAAASWRAHDGRRQRETACPNLYRYRLTHTYCSLARLPPTHHFVGAPILQRHFQVQWRARLPPPRVLLPHTCTQDGWFVQPKRGPARLPRRTVPSNCICRCSRMRARLSPPRVLLPHTCTQDGWFVQPKRRPARLPRRTVPSNCNQNADQLGSLAGLSLLTVYVGVVECAPASPYTYSSSTHRFPDERTPIEATPLSATSAELGLGLGLGLGLDSLSHSSSHALPFFSPPSFHTLSLSPAFTSVWWSA
jgi:hypothetical protein